jgi:membrane-associated phospholipid phosphatase
MSIVYLGEHYVVDILGGVTFAIVAIVVVESIAGRHAASQASLT